MGNGLIELGEDFVGTRVIFFRRREHGRVNPNVACDGIFFAREHILQLTLRMHLAILRAVSWSGG